MSATARGAATSPPPGSGQPNTPRGMAEADNTRLWLGLGAVVVAGGAYYYYTKDDDIKATEANKKKN